jgi:hypothetical protein
MANFCGGSIARKCLLLGCELSLSYVRLQFLASGMKVSVFWDVAPCSLVGI